MVCKMLITSMKGRV